jgi:ketosteroid isomerase-like protein
MHHGGSGMRAAWLAWCVADDILALQRAFDQAELNADVARLGDLLAEDFLSIGEQGFVLGKREWIGRHGEFRYLSIDTSEVDVRRYGEAAVVRCVQRSRASWRGEPMALAVRLSQVWIRQPAGWRIVAIQFSTLGSGWPAARVPPSRSLRAT